MVGTILSRILSRTKLLSSKSVKPDLSEEQEHFYPQRRDTSAEQLVGKTTLEEHNGVKVKTSKIHFEHEVKNNSLSRPSTHPSPRKHSFASVQENSDTTQSFTTRRLPDGIDVIYDTIENCWLQPNESREDFALIDDITPSIIDDGEGEAVASILKIVRHGPANLNTMPDEILDNIFSRVTSKPDPDSYLNPMVDLFNLLFVSKAVHIAALRVLYRHVKIPHSKSFFKFSKSLNNDESLGALVQCLDFSHYTNIGFGRAQSTSNVIPYLTPLTLKACLEKMTRLKAFLVHEHVESELDATVLSALFNIPSLKVLDLCGCSSTPFTQAFLKVCTQIPLEPQRFLSIERLSLHECTTLSPEVFELLLPRLGRLTHLEVAHTMINDQALVSLPKTAQITHLNLERCTKITGSAVVEFLTGHPAVKDTIVYLNLKADASRYRLLSEEDLLNLLPILPTSLRSLNIGGARVNKSHVDCLRSLATHVEELGLKGADLSLSTDIRQILSLDVAESSERQQHTVRYLDLTDVKSVTQMSLTYSPTPIIEPDSSPLEVIEVGEPIRKDIEKRSRKIKDPDWKTTELGRRGWYVRHKRPDIHSHDNGYRPWKMGAHWWGMRKIPVFEQETGGMYGYFMFKRA